LQQKLSKLSKLPDCGEEKLHPPLMNKTIVDVVIGIKSGGEVGFKRRPIVRKTWMSALKNYLAGKYDGKFAKMPLLTSEPSQKNATVSENPIESADSLPSKLSIHAAYFFGLGVSSESVEQGKVEKEKREHLDMLIFEAVNESYNTLTEKALMMMKVRIDESSASFTSYFLFPFFCSACNRLLLIQMDVHY
jgi:hypothetical protein